MDQREVRSGCVGRKSEESLMSRETFAGNAKDIHIIQPFAKFFLDVMAFPRTKQRRILQSLMFCRLVSLTMPIANALSCTRTYPPPPSNLHTTIWSQSCFRIHVRVFLDCTNCKVSFLEHFPIYPFESSRNRSHAIYLIIKVMNTKESAGPLHWKSEVLQCFLIFPRVCLN